MNALQQKEVRLCGHCDTKRVVEYFRFLSSGEHISHQKVKKKLEKTKSGDKKNREYLTGF